MSVLIYHNPNCSKSRQTLALLNEKGIDPEIIEYLKTPPDTEQIHNILKLLGISARELMRTKEQIYEDKNLADESLEEDELIAAMLEYPVLIERPIVISGGKAAIGRPPENILEII